MLKTHLKQTSVFSKPGCIYSACGLFTENKQRIQKNERKGRFVINLAKLTRERLKYGSRRMKRFT